ncbi:MAG: UDP-N-acetylmuramate--L-alanine ligase [Bacteroidales bacterium]|jgi:UDP-N-acetylmuramate--alanine ligase|nr:UDP-N-acetylmuramate--L-alanine ligase [Bacteroidales bacterium]
MNNFQNIKNVYFLGIGGIGMSALARYFKSTGCNVAGYDRMPTSLTDAMQKEGINIHFEDDIRNIPSKWNPTETLVIFTPALPDENSELSWFREKSIGLLKRAKILGMICNEKNGIAVAGTHGKTTVSTMVAVILNETKMGCSAFLGGISKNFENNLLLPKDDSPWIIAEADEFDRSFLNLHPHIALITSIDADHLDIYGDYEKVVEAFEKFISQIKPGGKLIVKNGVNLDVQKTQAEIYSYSLNEDTDFATINIGFDINSACYRFDLKTPNGIITDFRMNYPGLVNVENAVGAASLAFMAGVPATDIKDGIEKYLGVERRFDIRFKNEKYIYIDDYAHHPKELEAVINSVKALYPNRKLTGIFQPHLYSRTRDFAADFAKSLDLLDFVILLPIYPAREEPIKGVSSEIVFNLIKLENKILATWEQALETLEREETEIILTMGAGNIDRMAGQIIEILKNKN